MREYCIGALYCRSFLVCTTNDLLDGVNDDDKERIGHSEDHPDINHLNVSCARKSARDPHKAEMSILDKQKAMLASRYNVVRTRRTVTFTSMTRSR